MVKFHGFIRRSQEVPAEVIPILIDRPLEVISSTSAVKPQCTGPYGQGGQYQRLPCEVTVGIH